ncbi:N-acetylmuramate 1-kinase [Candidatus Magnetomoraceae bacterium gMMP-15]
MKAMILAAGFGTRLLPQTKYLPKPLFPVAGHPVLDLTIHKLINAGCKEIVINTHYLADQINSFLKKQSYSIPIKTIYEPSILGTGGAIRNAMNFLNNKPIIVINSDIITDIDLSAVYNFHLIHKHPVTLVIHNYAEFNDVAIKNGCVIGFNKPIQSNDIKIQAFTGIQVIDPIVLSFIPEGKFYSIIDTYKQMIAEDYIIKAYRVRNIYWQDIGSLAGFYEASYRILTKKAFETAYPEYNINKIRKSFLKGDGSDRLWYRLIGEYELPNSEPEIQNSESETQSSTIIMVNQGIKPILNQTCEVDSFIKIGAHLFKKGIPVPEIYCYDAFSGMVFMKDLGDMHLQSIIRNNKSKNEILKNYKSIINLLIDFSIKGADDFDLSWTYQTAFYDRDMILEKESRYFVESFLNGYLNLSIEFKDLKEEFTNLAETALENSITGLMHRDFQSRNIMFYKNKFYFIDFQGARMGPIQYDLASLLIDPYVELSHKIQENLLTYCMDKLSSLIKIDKNKFQVGYKYCSLHRNLQILGAFSYLSMVKGKKYFKNYIPNAIKSLRYLMNQITCPKLQEIINKLN